MKRVVKCLVLLMLLIIPVNSIDALSLSKNEVTLSNGGSEKIELYATSDVSLKRVDFNLVYSTYDIVGDFIVNSKYKDTVSSGTKHSIVFDKEENGKILLGVINVKTSDKGVNGIISLNNAIGVTSTNREIGLNSQMINITVGDTESTTSGRLIKSINSNIVKIELKDNIYKYDVDISNKINVLDLKPIPYNEECKIVVSSQILKEINDNKIVIKASLGDVEEEYIINLNIKKTVEEDDEADDEVFIPDNSYKKKWIVIIGGLIFLLLVDLIMMVIKRNN
ncbi:MAG: hypothetical protein IKF19_04970 [Bacilli bacterium]|nr:hypothetical protein [Bacilli bacterium]